MNPAHSAALMAPSSWQINFNLLSGPQPHQWPRDKLCMPITGALCCPLGLWG